MSTVAVVAEPDDALNLVPAPADRDVFSEDIVLVEANLGVFPQAATVRDGVMEINGSPRRIEVSVLCVKNRDGERGDRGPGRRHSMSH